jgi:hypothetical protein
MKFPHSILVTYRLDKLQYNFENVKIASYGGCHYVELFCIEDHKSVFDVTPSIPVAWAYRVWNAFKKKKRCSLGPLNLNNKCDSRQQTIFSPCFA